MTIFPDTQATARHRLKGAFAAVMTLALSGCGSLLDTGPPPIFYTLSPKSTFEPNLAEVDWQLVVEMPLTSGMLATQRIALTRDPLQIEYFASARWTERTPRRSEEHTSELQSRRNLVCRLLLE